MKRLKRISVLIIGMISVVIPSMILAADNNYQDQYRRYENRHFQDKQQFRHAKHPEFRDHRQYQSSQESQGLSGWFKKTFGHGAVQKNDRREHYRAEQFRYRDQVAQVGQPPRFLEVYGVYKGRRLQPREEQVDQNEISSRPAPKNNKFTWAEKLCEEGDTDAYHCRTIKRGESWAKLFKEEEQRDLVRRFNRLNEELRPGQLIAVPEYLENLTLMDIAPMDKKVDTGGKKLILVDLTKLAWAAYGEDGRMVKWGPASGGQNYCSDIRRECTTIQGVFQVFEKKGPECKSESFPVDRGGGSPMPYCMFFSSGFALHGSYELPGYNASHGCVRMNKVDAQWLNHEFVHLPDHAADRGTTVIVRTTELPMDTKVFKVREPDEYKETTKIDEEQNYYREEGVDGSKDDSSGLTSAKFRTPHREDFSESQDHHTEHDNFTLPEPEHVIESRNVKENSYRDNSDGHDEDVLQYDEERQAFSHRIRNQKSENEMVEEY